MYLTIREPLLLVLLDIEVSKMHWQMQFLYHSDTKSSMGLLNDN